jgi:hypothetical protein
MTINAVTLLLSDSRGIYIPRDFVCNEYGEIDIHHCAEWGLTEENKNWWQDAANFYSENYWDDWHWILDNAKFKDGNGNVYTLYQDGDLWALCIDKMTDEEKKNFEME